MMCARIAGRTDLWMPDDFGTYVTADTPASYFTDVLQPAALTDSAISTRVPILMYHHLAEDVTMMRWSRRSSLRRRSAR